MSLAWVSVAQVECIWNNGPSGCASGAHFNHTISTVLADGDIEWAAGRPPDLIYIGQKWTIEGRCFRFSHMQTYFEGFSPLVRPRKKKHFILDNCSLFHLFILSVCTLTWYYAISFTPFKVHCRHIHFLKLFLEYEIDADYLNHYN